MINYFRIIFITIILLFEIALYATSRFPLDRFVFTFPIFISYLSLICIAIVILKKGYRYSFMKYMLTTIDYSGLLAITIITRYYLPPGMNLAMHHMGATFFLFVFNALSGLRFDYRFSVWSVSMSLLFLLIVHAADRICFNISDNMYTANIIIMALCLIFVGMMSAIISQRARSVSFKHIQKVADLNLAQQIQLHLIPAIAPETDRVRFASLYRPMEEVGGDFFDYVSFDEGACIGLFISDVEGHGVSAAFITSMIKALIDSAGDERNYPVRMLYYLNDKMTGLLDQNYFTAFYGVYNTITKEFTYSRGGHPMPFVVRRNFKIEKLIGAGTFMGMSKNVAFTDNRIQLETGDKLLLYTDGLTEVPDDKGIMFEDKLEEKVLPALSSKGIETLVNGIFSELVIHQGGDRFDDDICIVGMEVL